MPKTFGMAEAPRGLGFERGSRGYSSGGDLVAWRREREWDGEGGEGRRRRRPRRREERNLKEGGV